VAEGNIIPKLNKWYVVVLQILDQTGDVRKDDYRLKIADCGFEIAQDRVTQGIRCVLKVNSCFTQQPVLNLRCFSLKSNIENLRS
jgi:hypothetical protein